MKRTSRVSQLLERKYICWEYFLIWVSENHLGVIGWIE